jgi:hypothetical protein
MQTSYTYRVLLIIVILSIVGCTSQMNPAPPPTPKSSLTQTPAATVVLDTIKGTFRNQIRILEENMPRSGSESYVVPTEQEQTDFAKLVSMIHTQDLAQAASLAMEQSYTLSYYVDRGDDYAMSYLLRENRPIEKGWGLYAIRVDSTSNIIVEAPHPLYDRRTPSLAVDIYRALDARALLIAGAHRNANRDGAADVAHAPESIFQSVHLALSHEIQVKSGQVIILQIHGFHSSKHEGYPQVVFGLGKNPQTDEIAFAERITDALADQGITAGICTGVESDLEDLCAKTNIQGSATKEGVFIHIELDEHLRKNNKAFITALVQVFGQ